MRHLAIHILTGAVLAALLSFSTSAGAQTGDSDERPGTAPLFADHSLLQVTIEAPLTTLMKDRPEQEYLDGTFSFIGDDGTAHTLDLKIRTRGNYRRMKEHCDFTPIRLNFRKAQVVDTEFDGQDKLKLVTHCKTKVRYYEQLVLREYLVYRYLQLMTDKSYSVRLFQITYVDTEGAKPITKVGFVIEDDEDVAEQIGMKPMKLDSITHDELEPRQENLVNVFQYLIGNTDFSLIRPEPDKACCHNADLMSATEGPPYIAVPYDFDFAGLVNASYAESNPQFKLRNVRQRLYRGTCRNNELLPETFQLYQDKKEAFYSLLDEIDLLSGRTRRDVTSYLNSFYEVLSRPKIVKARFIDKCTYGS